MTCISRFVRVASLACLVATTAAACGGSDDGEEGGLAVTSEIVSDSTTQEIRVLAPEAEGSWPVVVALHGLDGSGQDMAELATRVASAGNVVFVPTYHAEFDTMEDLVRAGDDLTCAYQLVRRTARDFGGDLTQPVTAVGWSLGAGYVLFGSLQELSAQEADAGRCPGQAPPPDVVVGISGCYYEFPVNWFEDESSWGNEDADIHLIEGDRDTVCPAWQTDKIAGALRDAGYDVEVVRLDDANHFAPVFHDMRDGKWQVITDDPPGEHTVREILDAIAEARNAAPTD